MSAVIHALEYCALEEANYASGEERVNVFEQHMLKIYPEAVVEISEQIG